MSKKIVFVNQSTGYITIDIINSFAPHFEVVDLIYGNIRIQDAEIDSKVRKRRILKKSRVSNLKRFFAWFFATIQIYFLLVTRYRKHEIFYFSLPPFAYLCSLVLKNKFSLVMFDVYPDVLKMLKIKESNIVYKTWAAWNKKLFAKAHRVYTLGDSLAELMAQYAPREKIHVIPLWTGFSNIVPVKKENNPFIASNGIQGKFIVQYSGNIGGTHNIECLIEAAILLRDQKDILFLIIGRGQKVPLVNKLIKENNLENCMLLPFQPDDVIQFSLAAADISVVLIEDKIADVSIPSKVFNIMAAGSSIMGVSPESSEISKLVKRYNVGANFSTFQLSEMADYILHLKNSPEQLLQYCNNSISASKNFTAANADKYYELYIKN